MRLPRFLAKHLDKTEVELVSSWSLQQVAGVRWLEGAVEAVLMERGDTQQELFVKKSLAYVAHRIKRIGAKLAR